jgi:hypothetical protein
MTKFALYDWLTIFFRTNRQRRQSEREPSSRLWLLPWHVPPLF